MRSTSQAPIDRWGPLPPHAYPPRSRRGLRWLERLFLLVAVICLGYYGYTSVESSLYQSFENRELDEILQNAQARAGLPNAQTAPAVARHVPVNGAPIGRIEIPRLHVSTIIRAGSDARTLRLAVGYIPGTALPGEPGNIGLAGHRDTFFRRLRDIRPDDEIRIVTPGGSYTYRVERTRIVNPTDVWVLDPTPRPALTLVTCYPFTYIGSAPQRFIVRATMERDRTAAAARVAATDRTAAAE
jgi:sortase A